MTTTWCDRNDVASIVGDPTILAAIDDDQLGTESPDETQFITDCIERAAVKMNAALACQYKLTDLLNNDWCKWTNAYLAAWHLYTRRGNAPPASVIDEVQSRENDLGEIRWGRFQVPEAVNSIESIPTVSNFLPEFNNSGGPIVVDTHHSTGAAPPSGRKRNTSNYPYIS